jgi:Cof subfamily protein (haloacid dehalogenase superfamily)
MAPQDVSPPIKLLVVDIDGTIAGKSNQINPTVVNTLTRLQFEGVKVALATGRMHCSALRFHRALGSTLPLISYNGAWIQNPMDGQIHRQYNLLPELVPPLLQFYGELQQQLPININCYTGDRLYMTKLNDLSREYMERSGVEAIIMDSFEPLDPNAMTKILAIGADGAMMTKVLALTRAKFNQREIHFTKSTPVYLEAINPQINKGVAVKYLAEEVLGLSPANVMAIGDNFNDQEMIQYAGIGVAMGNAPDELKVIADYVTADVEADGVVQAIEHWIN